MIDVIGVGWGFGSAEFVDDDDSPNFVLPLPLSLNTGFGMLTVCVFEMLPIVCRLIMAAPVDLFFAAPRSNADFVNFFGCTSVARNL